jgi:hypothetical protein
MGYLQEIDALGRWVYQVAGLKSHRLSAAPPQVTRPVILWEGPNRRKGQNLGRYHFIRRTNQYGKLFVNNLDQLADIMDKLEKNLADRDEWLPIYESDQANAKQIGKLRKVEIDFNSSETVDINFSIRYEVIYSRPEPAAVPAATAVTNKLKGGLLNG